MSNFFLNTLLLVETKTWGHFLLNDVLTSPQSYVVWLIVLLVVGVGLAFFSNYLEKKSTVRAMAIARGMVGTLIAFIIAPIAFFILLNVIALIYGIDVIGLGLLFDWIGLTISSYWWLLECGFDTKELADAPQMYSVHSIVRILWILVPFSFIWIKMSKTKIGKLFIIPLIIGTFLLARHKKAPSTFLTDDPAFVRKIPFISRFAVDPYSTQKTVTQEELRQKKFYLGGLFLFLVAGFVAGLILKRYLIGFILASVGFMGFLLLAPKDENAHLQKNLNENLQEHYHVNLDSLITKMNELYQINPDTIELYNLSLKIDAAYHVRIDVGANLVFPDSLCVKYESYFYDWCKQKQK